MLLKHNNFCIVGLKVQSAVCRVWKSLGKRKLNSRADEKSLWTVKETGRDEGQQIMMETVRQNMEASREELAQLRLIFSSFSEIEKNNRKQQKSFWFWYQLLSETGYTHLDNWNVFSPQIFQIVFTLWSELC